MKPIELPMKLDFQICKGLVFFYGTVRGGIELYFRVEAENINRWIRNYV